jgi:S1-C subfamily serine protease
MPPRPPRRRIGVLSYLGVALAAGALGAGTAVALYHPTASSSAAPQPSSSAIAPAPLPSSAIPVPSSGGSGTNSSEQAIVTKVEPGLVIINTTLQYTSQQAAATGMVINPNGLVLTNNHVIEKSTKITATVMSAGRHTYQAKVVGYDVTGDIALIQLEGASGLHTVPIGYSAAVKYGATVVAMGNAGGQSVIVPAVGRVTGLNQTITASDQGGTVTSETLHGMIETNAQIVSGDSGGPLANSAGQVIGMDTAGETVTQQQAPAGFAIPINTALAVARQIAEGHASSAIVVGYPPFIGIYIGKGSSSNPQTQAAQEQNGNGFGNGFGGGPGNGSGDNPSCYTSDANLGVPSTIAPVNSGTLVLGTICASPAAAAGMTAGSVITAVNGQTVGSPDSLTGIISKHRPGETISVTWVTPSGQRQTASLLLTAGPPQ